VCARTPARRTRGEPTQKKQSNKNKKTIKKHNKNKNKTKQKTKTKTNKKQTKKTKHPFFYCEKHPQEFRAALFLRRCIHLRG
jgi:hypothetical protein